MSLYSLSSAARSGFDTVMTTPQHSSQEVHFPGRQPRPLEIILDGSNGDHADRTLFPQTAGHSTVRSPISPWLPQHSPVIPVNTPGSATPFVTLSFSHSPIESEKAALYKSWEDVCLDVMNVEVNSGRSFLVKTYSASLIFLGIFAITCMCYSGVPHLEFGGPRPPDTTPVPHPKIQMVGATFLGMSYGSVDGFLGIPFAKPPIGDLRLRHPEPYGPYSGVVDATKSGPSCTQLRPKVVIPEGLSQSAIAYAGGIHAADDDSEDCLTLDVIKPAVIDPDTKLPVAVWFFGGGFQFGGTGKNNGIPIVLRSLELGEPVIFVVMNYRLNAFGFLASQEVKDAGIGNLGLHDQRAALRWIQEHIEAFGGDPTKVTIWGQSAGAISVSLQLVANGGDPEGLFRGAIMQSGAPPPVGDITLGQKHYDDLVLRTSCIHAEDTLDCLRRAPYETLKTAIDASMGIFDYTSMALSWVPRPDGIFIQSQPMDMVEEGRVARVPVINGAVSDEATLFTLPLGGIKTESELRRYLRYFHLRDATEDEMDRLLEFYSDDPAQGSPYGTGEANQVTPQWKRLSSIQGDLVFQGPRRVFLNYLAPRQDTWSYLSKLLDGFPDLGTTHSSDLMDVFGGGVMTDYFIRFINTLDPNGSSSPRAQAEWPRYDPEHPRLLTFLPEYENPSVILTDDDFRKEQIEWFSEMSKRYRM